MTADAIIGQARMNVAARQRDRGDDTVADGTLAGDFDGSWSIRHEIAKLGKEDREADDA